MGCGPLPTPTVPTQTAEPTQQTTADTGEAILPAGVSVISISFEAGGWNRKFIDMHNILSSSFPVSDWESLKFFDIWVSAPEDISGYQIQAKFHADDDEIGFTEKHKILQGITNLNDVQVIKYPHDKIDNSWEVQPNWDSIVVELLIYREDEYLDSVYTTLKRNPNGHAWYRTPPYVTIASLSYSVGAQPSIEIDFRELEKGITLSAGDVLELTEIWYRSTEENIMTSIKIEAYISSNGYDQPSAKFSDPNAIQKGVNKFNIDQNLKWSVPKDKTKLVLNLVRLSDNALLDQIVIPIFMED